MDNLLLEAIVSDLRPRLLGAPVFRTWAPASDQLIVLFDDPERSRLLLSASPDLPRLHFTHERSPRKGSAATAFSAAASHHLTGAVLASVEKARTDRIVRFRFAAPDGPGKSLIAELLGRASNLLLTDRDDLVIAAVRRVGTAARAPVPGAPYEPPRGAPRRDPVSLTRDEIAALAERSRRESHPLADLLLEVCPPLGALAASEIEARFERGEEPFAVLGEWLERAALETAGRLTGPAGGHVYAEAPIASLDPVAVPAPGRFLLSPLPLSSAAPDLVHLEWPALGDAAEAFYSHLAAARAFRTRRDSLAGMAAREAKRAEAIASKVARDLEAMEKTAPLRIYGEALLAGLTRAEKRGSAALVPDPYDPEERILSIPIDPALPLAANAKKYFARHRKAERGRAVLGARLASQSARSDRLSALAERIVSARLPSDLELAEAGLREAGIAVGLERRRRGAPPPEAPRAEGVRVFKSTDGWEILVGKGAEENDRLTFKIASPEDFWLHASGASGAHVIVRNPRTEPRLPEATLREAAELAAFFSKAKGAGRAEVIVTRRKHVRRARGAPRGTVTVKKKNSISAIPRNPFD